MAKDALVYAEEAVAAATEAGSKSEEANSLRNGGILYGILGDYEKAVECFSRALALYDELGQRSAVGGIINNIGIVYKIRARTWRLSSDVAQAIWLHHDFASLDEARFSPTVKNLVALGLVADHLVARYEQLPPAHEWTQYGSKCQAHLQIGDDEIEAWIDTLHDASAAVQL